ncbi:MAG: DNA polymerase III subunit delta [Oscillospiraceae bacterium]
MASKMDELKAALARPGHCPVYYLASTQGALLEEAAACVRSALAPGDDAEVTLVPGPVPSLDDAIAAAGVISFFGTPRLVELRAIAPSSMSEKDVAALAELFGEVSNAVLLVTALYKDKKTAASKKAKALFAAAGKAGLALEFPPPTRRQTLEYLQGLAEAQGARFAPRAAEALLERAGEDRHLLQNEVAKLAAFVNYQTITEEDVHRWATRNIEADVFELLRLVTAGKKAAVFQKLDELFSLRHEPVAISAALAGSYVDMLRVRIAESCGKSASQLAADYGYTGSPYRLQKAKQNAAPLSTAELQAAVLLLAKLDVDLKSNPLPDKGMLLQAALGNLMQLGKTAWKS